MKSKETAKGPIASPFVVIVDTREQLPWKFASIRAGADLAYRPVDVRTVRGTLRSGDYSIEGLEDRIALERKSLADLVGTLTTGRERFVTELGRLASLEVSAVIVEASWWEIATFHRPGGKVSARSLVASILAWQQRFPSVGWLTACDRPMAEALAYMALDRFWRDIRDGKRPTISHSNEIKRLPLDTGIAL